MARTRCGGGRRTRHWARHMRSKYVPNPRASLGQRSPAALLAQARKYQARLQSSAPAPTSAAGPGALEDAVCMAVGAAAGELSVLRVRDLDVRRAALEYAALYQRHVVRNDRVALELPYTRSVDVRPGADDEDSVPREARNKARTPVVRLDDALVVVQWPPPPELGAKMLAGHCYKPVARTFLQVGPGEEEEEEEEKEKERETENEDDEREKEKGKENGEHVESNGKSECGGEKETSGGESEKKENGKEEKSAGGSPPTDVDMPSVEDPAAPVSSSDALPAEPATIFVAPYTLEAASEEDERKHTVLLATVGPHDALVNFAADLLDWATERTRADEPDDSHFGLYRLKEASWVHEEDRRARKIDSVFLPKEQRDDLVDDARRFFSDETREWYADHGVPYRRAYLFHGPPGTGKTSMIKALASDLKRNSCFLSMMHGMAPEDVADAIAQLPPRPMMVIEDVDALFSARVQSKMTFSALLNVLDGMMSSEGVLTIMTTNHVTKIDPVAIRAGRVDRLFFFGPAGDDVLRQCFRYFYKSAQDKVVEQFVAVVQKERDVKARSIATLQEHFIEMREKSAEECVEKLPGFIKGYVNRATLLKELEDKFKAETGTEGTPFMIDGEKVNKYAEKEEEAARPNMFL